jgi:hypothetical protein
MIAELRKVNSLVKEIKNIPILSSTLGADVLLEIAIHNLENVDINYKILFIHLKDYNHNIVRAKIKKLESMGVINHKLGTDGRTRFIAITDQGWDLLGEYLEIYKKNPIQ